MTVAARDPLLDAPRAADIVLQQLQVVIRFQDKDVGLSHPFDNELCGMAEVGQKPDAAIGGVNEETNWIIGVVRDAEGIDLHVANFEGGSGDKEAKFELRFQLHFDGLFGEAVAINGQVQLGGEDGQALNVVGMLVSDEDTGQIFRCARQGKQTLPYLAGAEAGVDQ